MRPWEAGSGGLSGACWRGSLSGARRRSGGLRRALAGPSPLIKAQNLLGVGGGVALGVLGWVAGHPPGSNAPHGDRLIAAAGFVLVLEGIFDDAAHDGAGFLGVAIEFGGRDGGLLTEFGPACNIVTLNLPSAVELIIVEEGLGSGLPQHLHKGGDLARSDRLTVGGHCTQPKPEPKTNDQSAE